MNRLAYVINYTGVANVREAGKMDPICDDNGCTSLQKREENGVTFTLTNTKNDILNFEVVIASAPTEFVKQNPVRKTEFDKNGIPTTKYEEQLPIEVMLPEYYKGVATIHEVLGHVYLRTTQPNLSNSEHNRKVEKFETEIRQIYKIGNHDIKSAKKNKVKEGDPKYLKGSSDRHKE